MKNKRFSLRISVLNYSGCNRGVWDKEKYNWFVKKLAEDFVEQECTEQEILLEIHKIFYYISGLHLCNNIDTFSEDIVKVINEKNSCNMKLTCDMYWNYWSAQETSRKELTNITNYIMYRIPNGYLEYIPQRGY